MNREQGFKHFYKSDITHSLVYTEKERKAIVLQLITCVLAPLLSIPLIIFIYFETKQELVWIPAIILVIGSPIYINKLLGDTPFYRNFKRKIIGKIIKYINPSLDYDNLQKVDDIEFDNSKFFENTNTVIYGDDHVSGTINDAHLEFSELLVEFKDPNDKKEFNSKYQFRGMFFVAEFKYRFSSDVVIKTASLYFPDSSQSLTGYSEFNTLFKVKVVNGPETLNSVLTPNIINALLDLQNKIHNDFMISFIGNKIYLGVVHDEDLFEPTLFQSMNNFDKIKGYFDDLYFPIEFLEEITKQHP